MTIPSTKKTVTHPIELVDIPEKTLCVAVESFGHGMLHNKLTAEDKAKIDGTATGGNIPIKTLRKTKWHDHAHITDNNKYGFPAEAFLSAMSYAIKGLDLSHKKLFKGKKDINRALTIQSDALNLDGDGIVLYTKHEKPVCQEHMAKLKGTSLIPVYRPLFKNWEMTLHISYNSSMITEHDIMLLLNRAGKSIGIGAFRTENGGPFGQFKIVKAWYEELA